MSESKRVNEWKKKNTKDIVLTYKKENKEKIDNIAKAKGYKYTPSYVKDLIYKDCGIK